MRTYIAIIVLALTLLACTQESPTCSAPYIANGKTCCLDRDGSGTCDAQEGSPELQEGALDCSVCPPKFVVEKQEVIVYRYVCMNGSISEEAAGCEARTVSNAHLFSVLKDQDDAVVKTFDTRPACRGKFRAAEVHIETLRTPRNITIEVKDDPKGAFRDLLFIDGNKEILDNKYAYIGLCDDVDCTTVTDAQLPATGAYVLRAVLRYTDERTLTRERLIDPTPEGEFGQQKC